MSISADKIIAYVSKSNYRPVRPRELAQEMDIPEKEYRKFKNLVRDLVNEGGTGAGTGRTNRAAFQDEPESG